MKPVIKNVLFKVFLVSFILLLQENVYAQSDWKNRGRNGDADRTTSWTVLDINSMIGDTVITLTATDGDGNTGTAPVVVTGMATNVTANTAILNGTVNAGRLTTKVWFEYSTMIGRYDNATSPQGIGGLTDVPISASISGLLQSKTYYYRVVAQNITGTVYGKGMKLKTLDISAPEGSIVINGGDAYTNSSSVRISILAADNEGVTGYYFSTSNVAPSATVEGWTNVMPSPAYGAYVSYTLSSGEGRKTVYAWFKDADGNISGTVSDSIDLDTTAPVASITSPVSGDTYSTTAVLINLGGSAFDGGSGISHVIWYTDKGGSGMASGTTNWTISGISLDGGNTVITVTAIDGAGNAGSDTLTVSVSRTGLTSGLKSCYTFNEGSGTTAFDTSGNANNGIISGSTWTTGKVKGALKFNGVDNYVSMPRMNYDEISISAWFYKNAKDSTNVDAIIGGWFWSSNAQLNEGFDIRFSPTDPDTLEFILITKNAGGTRVLKAAKYNLVNSVGSWFHVVGVYGKSTGEQQLYINGQLVNTQIHAVNNIIVPMTCYPDIRIGHSRVNKGFFNGTIDEVCFYSRALSSQEVVDLYNAR